MRNAQILSLNTVENRCMQPVLISPKITVVTSEILQEIAEFLNFCVSCMLFLQIFIFPEFLELQKYQNSRNLVI